MANVPFTGRIISFNGRDHTFSADARAYLNVSKQRLCQIVAAGKVAIVRNALENGRHLYAVADLVRQKAVADRWNKFFYEE